MKGNYYRISNRTRISKRKVLGILMISLVLICSMLGQAHADIPTTERDALIALYNSTNGAAWTDSTGWNGVAGSECSWFGVICNFAETTVLRLDLPSNNLVGTIPAELGNLTNLERLYLQINTLSGSIPSQLGNLVNLEFLYLYQNQLSGSIPPTLSNLTGLRELYLAYNLLDGQIPVNPGLNNLTNLQLLWLGHNQLEGSIPTEIGSLTSLRYLSFRDNQMVGSIPSSLGGLTNLLELYLDRNRLDGQIPDELGNLASLMYLYLDTNQLSGPIPASMFAPGNLPNLQRLRLFDNNLSGSIPSELENLGNLQLLSLRGNNLSGSIPPELGNLGALESLYLYFNNLSGSIPPELGDLANLQILDISSNNLSGEIPISLLNLTSLTDDGSNLCDNELYTTDSDLSNFLIAKTNPDWNTCQGVAPNIDVDPMTGDYGIVAVNASSTTTYTVANVAPATAPLDVSAITLAGNADYSLNLNPSSNPCGSASPSIPIGGNCNVEVTFSPSSIDIKTATLNISSNDPDEPSIDVDLTGTGVDPADTDSDGLPDEWEQQIIDADPDDPIETIQDVDPSDDFDNDGLTNLQEYEGGSLPINARPVTPVLVSPDDGATDVSLMPELETDAFSDPDDDAHDMTRWQISTDEEFNDNTQLVFDFQSSTDLIQIEVPGLFLKPDTDYYWRANHTDSAGQTSGWPAAFMFSTVPTDPDDPNGNGIPDEQEVDCSELFNGSAIPANTVCVNSASGTGQVGVEPSTNVASIDAFMAMAPGDIPDDLANVSDVELLLGLISFKVTTTNVGDTIQMIFHFSEPLPENVECWKWDPDNGWYDYSAHIVAVSADRRSITIEYKDGDFGDMDKIANRVVIDPAGFGAAPAGGGGAAPTGGGGGGGGCFIVSVKDALPVPGNMLALILLIGSGIIILAGFNKKQNQQ